MEFTATRGKAAGIRFPAATVFLQARQLRRFISLARDLIRYCVRGRLRFVLSKRQERKLHMYRSLQDLFEEHSEALAGLPVFVSAIQELSELIRQIKIRVRAFAGIQKSAGESLMETAESVYDLLIPLCFALHYHGRMIHDPVLIERTLFNERTLRNLSLDELMQKTQIVAEEALAREMHLSAFGVNREMVHALICRVRLYCAMKQQKNNRFAEHMAARSTVAACCARADELLREDMDRLIELIRCTDARLYNEYFSIRDAQETFLRRRQEGDPWPASCRRKG
jgi:hypothetical protein